MENMTLQQFAFHLAICIMESPELGEIPMYLAVDADDDRYRRFSGDFDVYKGTNLNINHEGKVAVFFPNW